MLNPIERYRNWRRRKLLKRKVQEAIFDLLNEHAGDCIQATINDPVFQEKLVKRTEEIMMEVARL